MPRTATAVSSTRKPIAAVRKPLVERPHKNLIQTQEEIADLASDILLNGGSQEDLELMLTALLRHQWRRFSFTGPDDHTSAAKADQGAREHAARGVDDHYRRLARHWPAPKSESLDGQTNPKAKTITEMVRENIRASLQQHFDEFLANTEGIEPAWLLNEVLELNNSGEDLPEAFYYAVDRAEFYIRVPLEHKERIEEFVAFLEKERAD